MFSKFSNNFRLAKLLQSKTDNVVKLLPMLTKNSISCKIYNTEIHMHKKPYYCAFYKVILSRQKNTIRISQIVKNW